MKFTVEIDIELPRQRVIELFDDPDNLSRWMPGLVSHELTAGEPGQVGARSRLIVQTGKRHVEMVETITARNLPDEISGTLDAPGVHNVIRNRFIELSPSRTRWISENAFELRGLMRGLGLLLRSELPRQSRLYLEAFKAFAEDGVELTTPPPTPP